MAFEIGQRVGDYEIVQLLGVGGMGHVYRVRNVISDRTEAMKVLLPDLSAERDLAIRFISEIRTLASFDHPNIALLHTAFQAENQLIMMMEFVEGSTIEQRAHQGAMTVAEIAGYTNQALSALSYAHSRGVVHRDIKPANIMLTSHGIVKLMDFGIAKSKTETNLTRPGTTIGSLYYMSPEQVRGDAVDGRSDLYSVGIMLYELLAGRRPFEAETTFSILNQQLNTPPQPPIEINHSLPHVLNDIVLQALAKDPNHRFQTAEEFRAALRPFALEQREEGYPVAAALNAGVPPGPYVHVATTVISPPPQPAVTAVATEPPAFQPVPTALPPRQKSHKALWIATGVAAALLAMVGLALGLPRLLGTHAAESGQVDSAGSGGRTPPAETSPQAPDPSPPMQGAAASQTVAADTGITHPSIHSGSQPVSGDSGTPATADRRMNEGNKAALQDGWKRPPYIAAVQQQVGNVTPPQQTGSRQESIDTQGSSTAADLEKAQDRFTELSSRAAAVDGSLMHLRREQEAVGVGLRGDMEAADNKLQNYLRAADQDLRSSNVAAATKDLSRAAEELATLEKFLGR